MGPDSGIYLKNSMGRGEWGWILRKGMYVGLWIQVLRPLYTLILSLVLDLIRAACTKSHKKYHIFSIKSFCLVVYITNKQKSYILLHFDRNEFQPFATCCINTKIPAGQNLSVAGDLLLVDSDYVPGLLSP